MILFCFTADTLIPHASSSLQTGGGPSEPPTAPCSQGPVSVHAHRTEGITGSEEREGANGVGVGIGVGGGNGDGNGVGAGIGTGTGTEVEVNEGAQDGNEGWSGDGE